MPFVVFTQSEKKRIREKSPRYGDAKRFAGSPFEQVFFYSVAVDRSMEKSVENSPICDPVLSWDRFLFALSMQLLWLYSSWHSLPLEIYLYFGLFIAYPSLTPGKWELCFRHCFSV